MLHFWTDSRMVYVEKRRENTSQIASSACLRSNRSIRHHYVNVLRKNKVAKSGKKISHLQRKIADTNLRWADFPSFPKKLSKFNPSITILSIYYQRAFSCWASSRVHFWISKRKISQWFLSKEKQKSSVFAHFLTTQELNSSGAPNDDFLLNAMKTLFRKSRVLKDL